SGALAIAIAAAAPRAQVVAVERSEAAARYLRANVDAQRPDVAQRLTLFVGDVTDAQAMSEALGERDLIVANPPYVPEGTTISCEVQADPHDAVFSGSSGMDCIEAMTPIIAAALTPGGALAIEHDDTTAAAVCEVLSRDGRFAQIVAHRDLADRPRYVTARR
ncbi:MAG: methyltransferase, partial [Gordonia sp. (in: high G+C Gram-positive bacteria)]